MQILLAKGNVVKAASTLEQAEKWIAKGFSVVKVGREQTVQDKTDEAQVITIPANEPGGVAATLEEATEKAVESLPSVEMEAPVESKEPDEAAPPVKGGKTKK